MCFVFEQSRDWRGLCVCVRERDRERGGVRGR
jgi:hypothetical protein